ncbi:MAG: DUF2304 domain-containing protein [Dehalococcoidia bacterium]|nr:DUF2304 domain-containing protein [Dehalococcoidia bacterium]
MNLRQQVFALIVGLGLMGLIVDLVRRRKISEEYSWLWLATGAVIFILAIWNDLLAWITNALGIVSPPSTVFFFGVIFLVLVNLHLCLRLSTLTNQIKNLAQMLALMDAQLSDRGRESSEP